MSREPLSDALIRAAITPGQNLAAPSGLFGAISGDVRRTRQDHRALGWPTALRLWPGPTFAVPRLAWVLLTAALLTALLIGSLVAGARRPDRAVVIVPLPLPSPTVVAAESDVLATTKARPLPAQATCPAGSDPDAPGPSGQEGPFTESAGVMAFDRHAGRIILLAAEMTIGSNTWTFDVCANTWRRMSPTEEPPVPRDQGDQVSLVHDADSDRTLAFTDTGVIWSYDLAADEWVTAGSFPEIAHPERWEGASGIAALYHDRSGLVIVYDGKMMWAYDVDANTLAKVRQRPDPSRPAGSGAPDGTVTFSKFSLAYDSRNDLVVAHVVPTETAKPETWTFDPGTGAWRLEASAVTPEAAFVGGYLWPEVGTWGVFDEASGLVLFNERWANQLDEYDAAQRAWRVLPTIREPVVVNGNSNWCSSVPPVYDPLNERIVCRADHLGNATSAFSASSGEWRWLVEPRADPAPSGLTGTWATTARKPATLTLHACDFGDECGMFELPGDTDEPCVTSLRYGGTTGDGFAFQGDVGASTVCTDRPWASSTLIVEPTGGAEPTTLLVRTRGGVTVATLHRVAASPAPSASPSP